jgi:hypothetical protein
MWLLHRDHPPFTVFLAQRCNIFHLSVIVCSSLENLLSPWSSWGLLAADCLSVYLSVCLSICLSIYPSVCPSIRPSIHLSIYLFIYLAIYVSYLSVYPSIHPSIYLFIYLAICLSILSVYLSTLYIYCAFRIFVSFYICLSVSNYLSEHTYI